MDLNQGYTYDVESRLKAVIWVIAALLILVTARLFFLQVVNGGYYRTFSENNSIRNIIIPATRGIIFDRNGEVVTDNRPVFDLVVIPQYISDRTMLSKTLADILNVEPQAILDALQESSKLPPFKPYVVAPDVSRDIVARVRAQKSPFGGGSLWNLDGVDINYGYVRGYSEGDLATHVLGYVREIDRSRLEKLEEKYPGKFKQGDEAGVNGIEESYDMWLRGEEGLEQKVVNALGQEVNYANMSFDLIDQPEKEGANLYLTLGMREQRIAKRALAGKSGAVVAIEPKSGRILAMYSSPSYDLGRLATDGRNSYWAELINDPDKPLYNRAIQGTYPPASTYKIVTAVAALEEGVVEEDEKVGCRGALKFGNRSFGCWLLSGHGPMNIVEALTQSCDVFFYTAGLRLGVDRLARYASLFGLGAKTGVDLPGEKAGLIPTSDWKWKVRNAEWKNGDTLSASIGQGYNLVTPLQMALVTAEVANGGYRVRPHFVERIEGANKEVFYKWSDERERINEISDETIEVVKKGLVGAVENPRGTAARLKALKLKIAGKTGTAQVVGKGSGRRGEEAVSHAWFVGYAPYDDPRIAVAVIVEHGGHGAGAAAPVVAEVIKEYLK